MSPRTRAVSVVAATLALAVAATFAYSALRDDQPVSGWTEYPVE